MLSLELKDGIYEHHFHLQCAFSGRLCDFRMALSLQCSESPSHSLPILVHVCLISHVPMSRYMYQGALEAAAVAKDVSSAFTTLQAMKSDGVPCDAAAYDAVIRACGKAGQWHKAVEVLHSMVRALLLHTLDRLLVTGKLMPLRYTCFGSDVVCYHLARQRCASHMCYGACLNASVPY